MHIIFSTGAPLEEEPTSLAIDNYLRRTARTFVERFNRVDYTKIVVAQTDG